MRLLATSPRRESAAVGPKRRCLGAAFGAMTLSGLAFMLHIELQPTPTTLFVEYSESFNVCLKHTAVAINNSVTLSQPSGPCGRLRRNWNQPRMLSPQAQALEAHQSNCSLPVATHHMDNLYGMGSQLYVWSQALCNAMEHHQRLRTYNPDWLWNDHAYCNGGGGGGDDTLSPLLCYFPHAEFRCGAEPLFTDNNVTDPRKKRARCARVQESPESLAEFRAAAMEYLFQTLNPIVIREAERQIGLLFGDEAPKDLITVHMRWGDKFWEMKLPTEQDYVEAVCQLLEGDCNATANIYVASEDPRAVQAFRSAAPTTWTIFVDRTVEELNDYRPKKGNRASWTTRNTHGRAGLVALGSLLVALEATKFVLTSQSNWSRLMNHLRQNVIDAQCNNCTKLVDLRPGEW